MTPSINTSGVPFSVTTITIRIMGICAPPTTRNNVWRGERLSRINFNWKPLGRSDREITSTLVNASSTSFDTGKGTAGPIMSVKSSPLDNSGDSFRQRDSQRGPRCLEIVRTHGAIGVADAPKQLGIAQVLRGDVVQ